MSEPPETPPPGAGVVQAEVERLVDRTRGGQPWRRIFHAGNGLLMAGVLQALQPTRPVAVLALAGILAGLLTIDWIRLRRPDANAAFFLTFSALASPREAHGIASSTWYVLGVLIVVALFPLPVAISAVLVLALADPAASYLGRRYGRIPFLGGSLEGTAIFVLVATGTLLFRHPAGVAVTAAAATALAERVRGPFDDNLTVPIAAATSIHLASLAVLG